MYGGLSGGGFYGGGGPMDKYWHPGDGRMFWSGYESYVRGLRYDADAVRYGELTLREYGRKNGESRTVEELRAMADTHNSGVNPITGEAYSFSEPTVVGKITASGLLKQASGNSKATIPIAIWAGPGPKAKNALREAEKAALTQESCPTCDLFTDISDTKNYPGIKIYQTPLVVEGTGVTIPGIGILISSSIKPGLGMTQMLQHEYGHFLDYTFSPDINGALNPASPNLPWVNYMIIIGIPSAFDLMRGSSYDEHHDFYTEKRADQLAKIWFGSNYKGN
jgi:hypothetical protein